MKRTLNTPVWCTSQDQLAKVYNPEEGFSNSTIGIDFCDFDMTRSGWIRIGTATIHLDLIDPKDTVAAQVESLQAQIQKTMADSEATITILRSRINDLLAIENTKGE